jgi:hypothetical protein
MVYHNININFFLLQNTVCDVLIVGGGGGGNRMCGGGDIVTMSGRDV